MNITFSDKTILVTGATRGIGAKIAEDLSNLGAKLLLTGTPMPQAPSDLRAQFNFLYPQEHVPFDENLIDLFDPIYVRTTTEDLGLMEVVYKNVMVSPYPAFDLFYDEYCSAK